MTAAHERNETFAVEDGSLIRKEEVHFGSPIVPPRSKDVRRTTR